MREDSATRRRRTQPYRRYHELAAVLPWMISSGYMAYLGHQSILPLTLSLPLMTAALGMGWYRLSNGLHILRARSLLSGRRMELKPFSRTLDDFDDKSVCIGYGFTWKPEHTQKLHDLSRLNIPTLMLPSYMHRLFNRHHKIQLPEEIGMPYLHGLETSEKPLRRALKNFEGGLLIVGTTQAGKGVMLNFIMTQAILRGDAVIFIDPKGSDRMYKAFCRACQKAGRGKPLRFHPGNRSKTDGIRFDVTAVFSTGAQIATRVISVVPGEDNVFKQFAWSCIKTFADAMIELEQKPSLKTLSQNINKGIEDLLRALILQAVNKYAEDDWRDSAESFLPKRKDNVTDDSHDLNVLVSWYENVLPAYLHTMVVGECLKIFHHSKEHYSKITATLMPIFAMLTSGPLEESLSPDPSDASDKRPIWDMESLVKCKGVLYVNLDSLSDNMIASAVGSMLLSDLTAYAGKRYNLGLNDVRISLYVDEASNVINQPLIELLNKGAEGGVYTTIAIQTVPDLAHRLGSVHAARMVLGNCNNLIALRCKDRETQDFVTETFGKTYIHQVDTTLSTHTDTHIGMPSFQGGASHKRTAVREEIIPSEYLGKLPNAQFFASLGGGHLMKGRVPVITDDKE